MKSANTVESLSSCVTPDQRTELQNAAANPDPEAVIREALMAALKEINWKGRSDDILLLQCIEHSR